jgi:prophage antirepressor-like protein
MTELEANPERRIALFQRKEIRRTIHNNEWWFVITDVVAALTDSVDAADYLKQTAAAGRGPRGLPGREESVWNREPTT